MLHVFVDPFAEVADVRKHSRFLRISALMSPREDSSETFANDQRATKVTETGAHATATSAYLTVDQTFRLGLRIGLVADVFVDYGHGNSLQLFRVLVRIMRTMHAPAGEDGLVARLNFLASFEQRDRLTGLVEVERLFHEDQGDVIDDLTGLDADLPILVHLDLSHVVQAAAPAIGSSTSSDYDEIVDKMGADAGGEDVLRGDDYPAASEFLLILEEYVIWMVLDLGIVAVDDPQVRVVRDR